MTRKYERSSKAAKRLNRAVAEFICMDQIPISVVDKTGFRNLVKQLYKRYEMSRRKYKETEIPNLYNETRSVLESQLSSQPYFACTTDLWTSRTVDSYMAVTIYFISDIWEMQFWCLGCAAMHSDHTGENRGEKRSLKKQ